ncbi:MAG TPA: hypothetical protein VEU96_19985 [Bryobacteraceae bacterium]|nr:hypothetical protein [Bryobacteraceae bacterium]
MFEKLLAKQHIRQLDLGAVRRTAVEKLGWGEEKASEVETGYKRFLYALAHKHRDEVLSPPSQDVDEFWHQHILNTPKYRQDCDLIFGHYVDHTPGLDAERQRKADSRRREIYDEYDIDGMDFDSSHSSVHQQDTVLGHDSPHAHGSHGGDSCHDASGHACDSGAGDSGGGDGGGGGGDGGGGCGGGGCGGS